MRVLIFIKNTWYIILMYVCMFIFAQHVFKLMQTAFTKEQQVCLWGFISLMCFIHILPTNKK